MMQIEMGLRARGLPVRVMHIVDVLDIAYSASSNQPLVAILRGS
jgi:hypothetical protein